MGDPPNIGEVILWRRIWQRLSRNLAVWTIFLVIRGVLQQLVINERTRIPQVVFLGVTPRMPESATIVIGEEENLILFTWVHVVLRNIHTRRIELIICCNKRSNSSFNRHSRNHGR